MIVIKTDPRIFGWKASKKTCYQAAEMANKLKAIIYEYSEQVPLALAVGVLDIVKKEIMENNQ